MTKPELLNKKLPRVISMASLQVIDSQYFRYFSIRTFQIGKLYRMDKICKKITCPEFISGSVVPDEIGTLLNSLIK